MMMMMMRTVPSSDLCSVIPINACLPSEERWVEAAKQN